LLTLFANLDVRLRIKADVFIDDQWRESFPIAVGDENHLDLASAFQDSLDQAPGRNGLVVRMCGNDQESLDAVDRQIREGVRSLGRRHFRKLESQLSPSDEKDHADQDQARPGSDRDP
jgi:hypothetical protein